MNTEHYKSIWWSTLYTNPRLKLFSIAIKEGCQSLKGPFHEPMNRADKKQKKADEWVMTPKNELA